MPLIYDEHLLDNTLRNREGVLNGISPSRELPYASGSFVQCLLGHVIAVELGYSEKQCRLCDSQLSHDSSIHLQFESGRLEANRQDRF